MSIYNILFPAESDFVGWVQFATLTKDKRMVSLGYSDFEHIEEKVKNTKMHKSQNYYIMANTVKRFTKRSGENLFSLNNAKNSGSRTLILCEGYMDVISVNQAGFTNAVATLGTALTSEQAVLMKRYADEVIICYDADEAGQKATARAIPILRNAGLLIRVLTIPNGKDPDEFIRSHGADGPAAFKAVIEKSGNDVEYRLQKLKQIHNVETTDGKVAYLEAASKVIAEISSPI